ncbi:DUF167 domain-containing protein [Candidatus Saccharibacteria bacterium]|nr:DUF167 domain-containing protein [Candidatus Saccharibacteria bacterium]
MLISLLVKPGSKQSPRLERLEDGSYVAFLRERPHDGEANAALLKLLSKHFSVPKTSIKIKSGTSSRKKLIELP